MLNHIAILKSSIKKAFFPIYFFPLYKRVMPGLSQTNSGDILCISIQSTRRLHTPVYAGSSSWKAFSKTTQIFVIHSYLNMIRLSDYPTFNTEYNKKVLVNNVMLEEWMLYTLNRFLIFTRHEMVSTNVILFHYVHTEWFWHNLHMDYSQKSRQDHLVLNGRLTFYLTTASATTCHIIQKVKFNFILILINILLTVISRFRMHIMNNMWTITAFRHKFIKSVKTCIH